MISRQQLEEAVGLDVDAAAGVDSEEFWLVRQYYLYAVEAARALLDGEPLEWCSVHGTVQRPETVECWIGYEITIGNVDDLCRFESRVLVRVAE